jgi:hypothetical protein
MPQVPTVPFALGQPSSFWDVLGAIACLSFTLEGSG